MCECWFARRQQPAYFLHCQLAWRSLMSDMCACNDTIAEVPLTGVASAYAKPLDKRIGATSAYDKTSSSLNI